MNASRRNYLLNVLGYLGKGTLLHDMLLLLARGHSEQSVYSWAMHSYRYREKAMEDTGKSLGGKAKEDGLMQTVHVLKKIVTGEISRGEVIDRTWHLIAEMNKGETDDAGEGNRKRGKKLESYIPKRR